MGMVYFNTNSRYIWDRSLQFSGFLWQGSRLEPADLIEHPAEFLVIQGNWREVLRGQFPVPNCPRPAPLLGSGEVVFIKQRADVPRRLAGKRIVTHQT